MSNQTAGRPPIIADKAKRAKILSTIKEKLEHGMPLQQACEAVSLPNRSFCRYRKIGREVEQEMHEKGLSEPDDSYSEYQKGCWQFWRVTKDAELQAMDRNLLVISIAAQKNWQAAAWYLERRYPKHFARTTKIEGGEGKPVKVDVRVDDRREKVIKAIASLPPEQLRLLESVTGAVDDDIEDAS